MTREQAIEAVKFYDRHRWTFEIDDMGTVYVGGTDHSASVAEARRNVYNGPIVHVV